MRAFRGVLFAALAGCAASGGTLAPGVRYEAILTRDRYGVPHIAGRTPADVAYALGQAMSEDRAADLVHNLSAGSGRLAELFGPAFVEADRLARSLDHRGRAAADWPRLPLAVQSMVEAFAAGVNDWIAEHPKAVSGPVRAFDALDVVAWHRHLVMRPEVAAARFDADGVPRPRPAGSSANAWAVAGSRSSTGKPVLLIDPHGPFEGPDALYEAHLRAGGLDVWGWFPVGVPLPAVGATSGVAWTLGPGGADVADAFALRLNPADPDESEWEGKFERMTLRREAIRVRGPGGWKDVEEKYRSTRHGPVFLDASGRAYAARLGSGGHARALEQVWRMSTSRNAGEFKAALALDRLSGVNLTWASADGRIGYVQLGQVPERAGGQDWDRPVPGWTALTLPAGTLPFHKLAQIEDPQAGFLQACGTTADGLTPGLAWRKQDHPLGALGAQEGEFSARAQRAAELLAATRRLDLQAARAIAFDTHSVSADLWIPVIVAAWKEAGEPAELRGAVDLLRGWSRRADAGEAGMRLYRQWRWEAASRRGIGAGRDAFAISDTPEMRREALALLRAAVAAPSFARLAVPWGESHRLRRGGREWGLAGDGLDTLRAVEAEGPGVDGRWIARSGQASTAIVFLGAEPVIHAGAAYGQSADPAGPHYADQAPLFATHELRPVPWTPAEIVSQTSAERTVAGPR